MPTGFVILHDYMTGDAIRIKPETIVRYSKSTNIADLPHTVVVTSPGGTLGVIETPDEIDALIQPQTQP